MEMGLNLGVWRAPNSIVSVTSRMDGRGGKMNSFCAMYSLRMSFWIVPERWPQSAPCCSATTRYMAQRTEAGELMVIETVTSASGMPRNKHGPNFRTVEWFDANAADRRKLPFGGFHSILS